MVDDSHVSVSVKGQRQEEVAYEELRKKNSDTMALIYCMSSIEDDVDGAEKEFLG